MNKFLSKVAYSLRKIGKFLSDDFTHFCHNTVLPGFKYIGDRSISIWGRLFFLASFVFILGLVSSLITDIYAKWDSTPVIVGLSPSPTLINRLPFPTVTICNVNQASASRVRNLSTNSEEYSMLQTLCSRSVDNVNPKDMADIKNRTKFHEFIRQISQPCEDLFLSCKFGTITKNCKDIFKSVLTDEGLCCVFNSAHSSFVYTQETKFENFIQVDGSVGVNWDPETGYHKPVPKMFYPRVATGIGISQGLSIVINAETHDYFCSSTNGVGFKLLLHNPIEIPSLRENGLLVRPGAESTFRIDADRSEATHDIRGFSIDDRQCVFKSERHLAYFKTYTRRNCELECLANMTARFCGCISYFLPKTWANVSVCSLKDLPCLQPITYSTPETAAIIKERSCKQICMQGCFDLSFTPSRFAIPLTSGGYIIRNEMLERFNTTYLHENIAVVHFYYKLSTFNGFMRTRFIGTTEFLSNTGGLIGLIGFSFISVAEVLFYIILKPFRPIGNWISNFFFNIRKRNKGLGAKKLKQQRGLQIFDGSKSLTTKRFNKMFKTKVGNRVAYR